MCAIRHWVQEKRAFTTLPEGPATYKYGRRVKIVGALNRGRSTDVAAEHIDRVQWFSNFDNHLFVYTDASRLPMGPRPYTSGAFAMYHLDKEVKIDAWEYEEDITSSKAELFTVGIAARRAIHYVLAHKLPVKHLHIFSDNDAAVRDVVEAGNVYAVDHHIPATFKEMIDVWFLDRPFNTIEIAWIPGHAGIKGNERADELAGKVTANARARDVDERRDELPCMTSSAVAAEH